MQDSMFTLLPPLLAIAIAIWRRNAMFALFCGLLVSHVMLVNGEPIEAMFSTVNGVASVFSSQGNLYIVGFSLLIGSLVALCNQSGAVNGFIEQLSRNNLAKNSRQASLLPTFIGSAIFTDTNLSMFTAGMASQRLFDQHKLSRARLAYLLDSTCAPISILFLINGWGAYVLGLLDGYAFDDPVGILISTIAYNTYAIVAVLLAYFTAATGNVYGAMKLSKASSVSDVEQDETCFAPGWFMWLPMLIMLVCTFILLYLTGEGDIRKGSGSFAVFWSVFLAIVLLVLLILSRQIMSFSKISHAIGGGVKTMIPAVTILVLSFAFGDAVKTLGTGTYVSQLISSDIPLFLLAPALFIAAAIMAFATGTSWGTFAILIPIAVPIALQTGLPIEFLVAAVLGGGIFGDHASPISDTTVVASIASGCDHYEHVRTQMPYALVAAVFTVVVYVVIGLNLS